MNNLIKKVVFYNLGLIDYKKTLDYQEVLFQKLIRSKLEKSKSKNNIKDETNYLLFCEHPHVYTLGKSGDEKNLLINYIQLQSNNASFYKINRGGDITYHGPGQIVGYPIIDLEKFNMGVKQYVYNLEEAIILTLKHFDIKGERLKGATGVWIDTNNKASSRKICAIGVRCSRYVTMHGFALNINTDLSYFNNINPCGYTDKAVTSISVETGKIHNMEEVENILLKNIVYLFEMSIQKKISTQINDFIK
jgi:lipoyl(octanoyl) transferase